MSISRALTRGLATASVLAAGVAVGAAAPAQATNTITGVYTYNEPGAPAEDWTIYSTCVPLGCTLHIATNIPGTSIDKAADFRLTQGLWAAQIPVPDGVTCADGKKAPSTETYIFDSATLTGTHTHAHAEVCGLQPTMTKNPFTLTYVKPTPVPNNEHPLWCDDPWWCPW